MVQVGGDAFEYTLSGGPGPAVVFFSGFRMLLHNWDRLFPQIECAGRVFAYNRHGVGHTSMASQAQTGETVVNTLRSLLTSLDLPPLPLTVVTGTKRVPFAPERSFKIHLEFQQELLKLSPDSRKYVAEKSGHFPHITEPGLVLQAVLDTAERVRAGA